jgi:hypothetical protein
MEQVRANLGEGGAKVTLFEGSHVLPACPSNTSSINIKTLKL